MTFGEKFRTARKEAGFTQEQLAEKLSVSRSAIAKWESDNGMPDVNNLKAISELLNVSIDYLLSEDDKICFNETREPINLENYVKTGKCRDKKDQVCYEKYKDAEAIYPLIRKKKLNWKEQLLDLFTFWGASQMVDYANNNDGYYLVEKDGRQYLVRVSSDFISTSELATRIDVRKFVIGNNVFTKCTYQLI